MSIFLHVSDNNHRGDGKKTRNEEKKDVFVIEHFLGQGSPLLLSLSFVTSEVPRFETSPPGFANITEKLKSF